MWYTLNRFLLLKHLDYFFKVYLCYKNLYIMYLSIDIFDLWSLTDELQLLNKKREVLEDKLRGNIKF